MNARSLVLLLVLCAAGLLAGLWVWIREDGAAEEPLAITAGAPRPEAAPSASSAGEEPASLAPAEERAEREEARVAQAPRAAARAPRDEAGAAPASSIWIEGRLSWRDGTPVDEVVRVEARGKKFESGIDGRSHFTKVQPDGRFRSAFAAGTRTGWIEIEARYQYLAEKKKVELAELAGELVLEPKLGGLVRGQVRAPLPALDEAAGFEGASANLARWGGDVGGSFQRSAKLDAEGRFEFHAVPPGAGYRLELVSKTFAKTTREGVAVKPGEVTEVLLEPARGVPLRGRVLGPDGQPLANASLVLCVKRGGSSDFEHAMSSADGSFDLGAPRPGVFTLSAEREGFERTELELGELREGDAREELVLRLGAGRFLEGLVLLPSGEPAEGAWVSLAQESEESEPRMVRIGGDGPRVKAGADGRFRFGGLGEGLCTLSASLRPGLETDASGRRFRPPTLVAHASGVAPGARELQLVLGPGDSLRGRVLDDLGAPIQRFSVRAEPRGEGGDPRKPVSGVFQSAEGAFELAGLLAGAWEVQASSRDHAEGAPVPIDIPSTGAELVLRLARPARIGGRVIDPGGSPVAGAGVLMQRAGAESSMPWLQGAPTETRSDDAGEFLLKRAPPGRWKLVASAEGLAESEPLEVELAPAAELGSLTLALRRGGRITGTVHPAAGEVEGRSVEVRRREGQFHKTVSCDAQGAFALDGLSPGTYVLSLELEFAGSGALDESDWILRNQQRREQRVELAAGASAHVVLGAPTQELIAVSGRVTQGGAPVAGIALAWDAPARRARAGARTEADGSYSVLLEGAGDWQVAIGGRWNDRVVLPVQIPKASSHRQDFELPVGQIGGLVRGPSGEPARNCPVILTGRPPEGGGQSSWANTRRTMTDAEGRYEFDMLRAGQYTLRAGGAESWEEATRVPYGRRAFGPLTLGEGESMRFDMVLQTGGTVEGTVLDSKGLPVPGVTVALRDLPDTDWAAWSNAWSDQSGRFKFRGVAPGEVLLRIQRGSGDALERTVRVGAGDTARVEFVLP